MKTAVFVDKTIKMSLPSINRGVFVDGSRGYLLYLYDVIEMVKKKENQI